MTKKLIFTCASAVALTLLSCSGKQSDGQAQENPETVITEQQLATVKGSQWNEWLAPLGDFATEMKESFGKWRDVRVKIQKQLGGPAGTAYDKMTADLHALMLVKAEE